MQPILVRATDTLTIVGLFDLGNKVALQEAARAQAGSGSKSRA